MNYLTRKAVLLEIQKGTMDKFCPCCYHPLKEVEEHLLICNNDDCNFQDHIRLTKVFCKECGRQKKRILIRDYEYYSCEFCESGGRNNDLQ